MNVTPKSTPRGRKTKPAPLPPTMTSTPSNVANAPSLSVSRAESPIANYCKDVKDETNRNRQEQNYTSYLDKSMEGKWKRKKGPAPARPIPTRRKVIFSIIFNYYFFFFFPISERTNIILQYVMFNVFSHLYR